MRIRTLLLLTLLLLPMPAAASDEHASASPDPSEVLRRLADGNRRFVEGHETDPHCDRQWRESLKAGQHPFATILCCSDSRVPPEMVFDQGFGDLFVVRLAGNVVDPDVEGSIEYGVLHAGTPLILVLGHENCGAVQAALSDCSGEPAEIQGLVGHITPCLPTVQALPPENRVAAAVDENVKQSVRTLREIPVLAKLVEAGKLRVEGAVYDLDSGEVRMLEIGQDTAERP